MEYKWGQNEDGSYYSVKEEIPSHTCSAEELGLTEGPGTTFFPIHENSI